jgi:alkylmercury lyase
MTPKNVMSVDELAEAACCRLPELSPEEQRVGIVLLHELARGAPVTINQLAKALGMTAGAAESFVKAPALKPLLHADDEGRILAFGGLTGAPTHHKLTINGRNLWAWCAMDSLLHPELLDETAAIESRDPETGKLVRLTISPTRVESAEPKGIVVSWARSDTWDPSTATGLRESACHFIFFFASRASAERWQAKHPDTVLLSLVEAFALGKRINEHLFGTELGRRKTDRRAADAVTPNDITTADELWDAARHHFPVVSQEEQRAGIVLLRELARGEKRS